MCQMLLTEVGLQTAAEVLIIFISFPVCRGDFTRNVRHFWAGKYSSNSYLPFLYVFAQIGLNPRQIISNSSDFSKIAELIFALVCWYHNDGGTRQSSS